MSQEKVDRYKSEKANRKKALKHTKMKKIAATITGAAVCIIIVGWIGYSGYSHYHSKKAANPKQTEINLDAVTDYFSSLSDTKDSDE